MEPLSSRMIKLKILVFIFVDFLVVSPIKRSRETKIYHAERKIFYAVRIFSSAALMTT